MGKKKLLGLLLAVAIASAPSVFAQATIEDALTTAEGGVTKATTMYIGIAGLSAAAFVFGLVMTFGRKGKK